MPTKSYSRARDRQGSAVGPIFARPFCPVLFHQEEQPFPTLLLDVLREQPASAEWKEECCRVAQRLDSQNGKQNRPKRCQNMSKWTPKRVENHGAGLEIAKARLKDRLLCKIGGAGCEKLVPKWSKSRQKSVQNTSQKRSACGNRFRISSAMVLCLK